MTSHGTDLNKLRDQIMKKDSNESINQYSWTIFEVPEAHYSCSVLALWFLNFPALQSFGPLVLLVLWFLGPLVL